MKTDKAEARPAEPRAEARPEAKPAEVKRAGRRTREVTLAGLPIAPGVAIGPAYDTSEPPAETPRRAIQPAEVEEEKARLTTAAATSRKQVSKLKKRLSVLPEEAQEELEPLLDAYAMMLGESRLLRGARKRIEAGLLSA
ncbi:phosphoenolpyruvate-utilizing N-terminal domain-containing protein, partial [Roseomonas sp. DSM 102946]|nr:phosphoenolpyruvate-utilizing N-terminal domain-containing protein [Roseomonas sp. DSM 102946]